MTESEEYARDYRWNLYQRSYIRWDMHCEDVGLDRQRIYNKMSNVDVVSIIYPYKPKL